MEEGDRPQAPVLACGDGQLVELEPVVEARPSGRNSAVSETTLVTAMISSVAEIAGGRRGRGRSTSARRRCCRSPWLSQPRRLAISALSSAAPGDRPPGTRRWRPAGPRRGLAPPRCCARRRRSTAFSPSSTRPAMSPAPRLVVEPVADLGQADQRGGRDRRVVEADDAQVAIAAAGIRPARGGSPALPGAPRPRASQPAGDARVGRGPAGRTRSRADCTGAAEPSDGRRIGPRRHSPRLARHVRTVHPGASRLGARRDLRGRAAGRRPGRALQRRPDRRGAGRRPARGSARDHRLPLGPHPPLGERGEGRLADVQRPRRDADREPGLPRRIRPQALPRPGRFVLRVEARGRRSASRTASSGATARPLVLAGLWAGWRDPATDTVRRTFTIITTTPNEALADLHDRMPVVLSDGRLGRAGSTRDRPIPASCSACSSRTRRSSSTSTR